MPCTAHIKTDLDIYKLNQFNQHKNGVPEVTRTPNLSLRREEFVNVNMELDKNVNLEIGQFVPILFH